MHFERNRDQFVQDLSCGRDQFIFELFVVCDTLLTRFFTHTHKFSIFQHHVDSAIGVYIIDRYTYYALEFLEKVEADSKKTLGEFVSCSGQWVLAVLSVLSAYSM